MIELNARLDVFDQLVAVHDRHDDVGDHEVKEIGTIFEQIKSLCPLLGDPKPDRLKVVLFQITEERGILHHEKPVLLGSAPPIRSGGNAPETLARPG